MAFKNFKLETDADGIALVTWDIPGRSMNVLDETSTTELEEILKQTTADAAVKGVVITSAKDAFCAGADLSMLEGMNKEYAKVFKEKGEVAANQMLFDQSRRFSLVLRGIETCGKPWAAAINGLALGGGFEVTLSCHYRVAAENPKTRLGLPEVKVGLFPGAGGTQRLTRAVGKALAMDVILGGRRLSAREALAAGLVARVVAKEAWLDEAKRLARDIASKGPVATRLAKESVNRAYETTLSAGLEAERRALYLAFASEDAKEGLTAFGEKRPPDFEGR